MNFTTDCNTHTHHTSREMDKAMAIGELLDLLRNTVILPEVIARVWPATLQKLLIQTENKNVAERIGFRIASFKIDVIVDVLMTSFNIIHRFRRRNLTLVAPAWNEIIIQRR